MEIKQIATNFSTSEIMGVNKITGGHINQTYWVSNKLNERFVLQKINASVFKNPADIIDNLQKINDHLNSSDYPYRVASLRPTIDNETYLKDKTGFWRAMEYIGNSKNLQVCPNAKIAALTGKAYGSFIKYLQGLSSKEVKIVIPYFRNPEYYFQKFEEAIKINYNNRIINAEKLIFQAKSYRNIITTYNQVIKTQPIRLVHNDTKISNLLFNKDFSEVQAVIDFDTVMPGYIIDDFGDMVRSVCNLAAEDETDLSKVVFNIEFYKSLTDGYLSAINNFITPKEKAALIIGAKTIIYTQLIRFLSDYLSGDNYYRIEYETQNLNRAKVQMVLLKQTTDNNNYPFS